MFKEFLADIYFLRENEGGRKTDILNKKGFSFRPLFCYHSINYHCQLDFDNIDEVRLGNKYQLKIRIIDICPVEIGSNFELKEVSTIARGKIIDYLCLL